MEFFSEWGTGSVGDRICSVTTGLVKNNWDDKHPGMIQAEYFLGTQGKNVTGWMPVASMYAFNGCGLYFLPEIGSEVVIAFNMGDRNCPIAVGCLWNKKNVIPAETAVEKNIVKRLKTKGGCEVVFVDEKEKESIEIHTPAGFHLRIDDEKKVISIEDKEKKNGICIEAEKGSVKLAADKKMIFEASGKEMLVLDGGRGSVSIKGDDIKEEASKSYAVKGQNVKLEGTQMALKGNSQLNVQSGGVAQIKGSMVKIN